MTPTRSELAAMIRDVMWNGTWHEAADVVLPLLEAKDAEIERLKALYVESEGVKGWDYANVRKERDEARAENERLRNQNQEFNRLVGTAITERDEARRIADQLAEAPMWGTWYQPGVTNAARKAWEGRSWREAAPRSRT